MAQQYDGGQSVDLDLDKDFLMQSGDFLAQSGIASVGDLDAELGLDSLEYGADPELIAAMNQGIPIASPAQPVSEAAQEAKDKIKGEGLSAFTKGLQRGLGGFLKSGQTQQPAPQAQPTQPSRAGVGLEGPNWVIPALIGAIGIAVVVFAMGKRKQTQVLA